MSDRHHSSRNHRRPRNRCNPSDNRLIRCQASENGHGNQYASPARHADYGNDPSESENRSPNTSKRNRRTSTSHHRYGCNRSSVIPVLGHASVLHLFASAARGVSRKQAAGNLPPASPGEPTSGEFHRIANRRIDRMCNQTNRIYPTWPSFLFRGFTTTFSFNRSRSARNEMHSSFQLFREDPTESSDS